jgi:hypothetical protein
MPWPGRSYGSPSSKSTREKVVRSQSQKTERPIRSRDTKDQEDPFAFLYKPIDDWRSKTADEKHEAKLVVGVNVVGIALVVLIFLVILAPVCAGY